MRKSRVPPLLLHVPPVLHLCACSAIAASGHATGWKYMFVADLPASALVVGLAYNYDRPLLLFGVIGTLWWYVLGCVAARWWLGVTEGAKESAASRPTVDLASDERWTRRSRRLAVLWVGSLVLAGALAGLVAGSPQPLGSSLGLGAMWAWIGGLVGALLGMLVGSAHTRR